MSDGYLSKDREHLARLQRARRARMQRIDYMPSPEAMAAIDAKRGPYLPLCTNSGVIDSIVTEWAELTGIKCGEVDALMTSADAAGISDAIRAPACDFGSDLPAWAEPWLAANRTREASRRVICGARRRRDGQPCKAASEPGKRRCKWHGGCSTGPRSAQGKARALGNLKQNQAASAANSAIAPSEQIPR